MSGVFIIGTLLRGYAPLTAILPAAQIKGDRLDLAEMRALLVRSMSLVERQSLTREEYTRTTERISVTARSDDPVDRDLLLRRARAACAGINLGALGEARSIAILTAGTGPDVDGPGGSYEKDQDFSVSYDAPA